MTTTNRAVIYSGTDLEKRIRIFLGQQNLHSLRSVVVSAENGTVNLFGRMQSLYEKQLCLSYCRRVAGVIQIVDDLRVDVETMNRSR